MTGAMRTTIWVGLVIILILAVMPAASVWPFVLAVVPLAIVEPGSLLLLGLTLLTLAGLAQRILFS